MKDKSKQLEQFIFKPLLVSDGEDQRLVICFGSNTDTEQSISPSGKKIEKSFTTLNFLDISSTNNLEEVVMEECTVTNIKHLKQNVEVLDIQDVMSETMNAAGIVIREIEFLHHRIEELGKMLTAVKFVCNNGQKTKQIVDKTEEQEEDGNIIFAGSEATLAHVVFRSLSGIKGELSPQDVDKIGTIIMQIMRDHSEDDLDNKENLKKFKAEIEYKIVDALPSTFTAGDIKINIDAIVKEIKDSHNDDDEEDGEDEIEA